MNSHLSDSLKTLFLSVSDRSSLARLLAISDTELCYILYGWRGRERYRQFEIGKKSGGTRKISSPPRRILLLQRRLLKFIESSYGPLPCVTGFTNDRSIVYNAKEHCSKRFVLNLDLLDFFPSIHIGRVIGVFGTAPFHFPEQVAVVLGQLVTMGNGELPQGGATSPIVSNLVCRSLDKKLMHIAREFGCRYTRYADDISFSTGRSTFPQDLARVEGEAPSSATIGEVLGSAVESQGFNINEKKVRLLSDRNRQEVTGLTTNEFPNVKREFVRSLRATLHCWDTLGYEVAQEVYRAKYGGDPGDPAALRSFVIGRLAYLRMVRGRDDPVYRRLRTRLHFVDATAAPLILPVDVGPTPLRGVRNGGSTWTGVFERCRDRVFLVNVDTNREGPFGRSHSGSAFLYRRDQIATAGHNVENHRVRLSPPWNGDGRTPVEMKFRNVANGADCSLIRLNLELGAPLPTQERMPMVGEEVAAIGYPTVPCRDSVLVLHTGVVSALSTSYETNEVFIQVSFESPGGLSGAPLLDRRGNVLGIMVGNAVQPSADGAGDAIENVCCQPGGLGPAQIPERFGQAVPIGYMHYLTKEAWLPCT